MSRERGFTLVELLVASSIAIIVLAGVATLLQSSQEIAVEQFGRIERQRGIRGATEVLRDHLEFAGFGGLPIDVAGVELIEEMGVAIAVRNAIDGEKILVGSSESEVPSVVDGTDVLTVRGAFGETVYWLSTEPLENFRIDPADETRGDLYVQSMATLGSFQDLEPLVEVVENARSDGGTPSIPEALLVVSAFDPEVYCILELDADNSNISDPSTQIRLRVLLPDPDSDRYANDFQRLCPDAQFPAVLMERLQRITPEDGELAALGTIAVLSEYRFYLRQATVQEIAADGLTPLPRLSRARVIPGTEEPWGGSENYEVLREDVSRGVGDFQVAIGFDTAAGGGAWADGVDLSENAVDSTEADDWLYNSPNDDLTKPPWDDRPVTDPEPTFQYLRITGLFFTETIERGFAAPNIGWIEDREFEEGHPYQLLPYSTLRRDEITIIVDAKNLRRYR